MTELTIDSPAGVNDILRMLDESKQREAKLREALEFYANPSDYVAPYTGGLGKLYFDCGTKAKKALSCEYRDSE